MTAASSSQCLQLRLLTYRDRPLRLANSSSQCCVINKLGFQVTVLPHQSVCSPHHPSFSVCVSVLSSFHYHPSQVSRPSHTGHSTQSHILICLYLIGQRDSFILISKVHLVHLCLYWLELGVSSSVSQPLSIMPIYLAHISFDILTPCLLIYKNVLRILGNRLSSTLGTGKCLLPIINCQLTLCGIPHPRATLNFDVIIMRCLPTILNFAVEVLPYPRSQRYFSIGLIAISSSLRCSTNGNRA